MNLWIISDTPQKSNWFTEVLPFLLTKIPSWSKVTFLHKTWDQAFSAICTGCNSLIYISVQQFLATITHPNLLTIENNISLVFRFIWLSFYLFKLNIESEMQYIQGTLRSTGSKEKILILKRIMIILRKKAI